MVVDLTGLDSWTLRLLLQARERAARSGHGLAVVPGGLLRIQIAGVTHLPTLVGTGDGPGDRSGDGPGDGSGGADVVDVS